MSRPVPSAATLDARILALCAALPRPSAPSAGVAVVPYDAPKRLRATRHGWVTARVVTEGGEAWCWDARPHMTYTWKRVEHAAHDEAAARAGLWRKLRETAKAEATRARQEAADLRARAEVCEARASQLDTALKGGVA